jgi:hypothetical protein
MATFPTKPQLSQGESPSLYDYTPEDNKNGADTDGGYEFRRRRFTRANRGSFKTGFIGIPHSDYLVLKAFFDAHQYDVAFTWHDRIHGTNRTVRFDKFKPDYKGIGQNRIWDIKIEMSEI